VFPEELVNDRFGVTPFEESEFEVDGECKSCNDVQNPYDEIDMREPEEMKEQRLLGDEEEGISSKEGEEEDNDIRESKMPKYRVGENKYYEGEDYEGDENFELKEAPEEEKEFEDGEEPMDSRDYNDPILEADKRDEEESR
jgi:hypothetical protein